MCGMKPPHSQQFKYTMYLHNANSYTMCQFSHCSELKAASHLIKMVWYIEGWCLLYFEERITFTSFTYWYLWVETECFWDFRICEILTYFKVCDEYNDNDKLDVNCGQNLHFLKMKKMWKNLTYYSLTFSNTYHRINFIFHKVLPLF